MHEQRGPWIKTAQKKIYSNPWISVVEDAVIRPDGKPGIYGVVTILDGATIVALDDDQNVYLTKGYEYAAGEAVIQVLAGGTEAGESMDAAAARELQEEAGIVAKTIIPLGFVYPYTSLVEAKDYLYLAMDLTFGTTAREGTESFEIIKVPFKQAYNWAMDGTITHASSIVCIIKAKVYLDSIER